MRTVPRALLPPGLRALLAVLLLGGFGYRVMASPAAWGCMTPGSEATSGADHAPGHQHGHRHHGPDRPNCECVAHASTTGLTVKSLELGQPRLLPRPVAIARFGKAAPPAAAPAHLLPFSVGPPPIA